MCIRLACPVVHKHRMETAYHIEAYHKDRSIPSLFCPSRDLLASSAEGTTENRFLTPLSMRSWLATVVLHDSECATTMINESDTASKLWMLVETA